MHDKALTCSIEKPTFSKAFLALNAGANIQNKQVKVLKTECLVLDGTGKGTLTGTPIGNVSCFIGEDEVQNVTAAAQQITCTGWANKKISAIYEAYETVDTLTIETTVPPKVVDLTLFIEVRDDNMNHKFDLQYNIPKFQIDGNYESSLSADGVSNESLNGSALNVQGADCSTGDMYATIKWVPVGDSVADISAIVITNGDINASAGTAATIQLKAVGVRGGMLGDVNLTSGCTFAVSPSYSGVTVSGNTLSIASTAVAGTAYIRASYQLSESVTLTDTIAVILA